MSNTHSEWFLAKVKKGDQLGYLIQDLGFNQTLYGKKGLIAKVLERNPDIQDPNQIYVGQFVNLPSTKEDLYEKNLERKEIKYTKQEAGKENKTTTEVFDESWRTRFGFQLGLMSRDVSFNNTSGSISSEIIYGLYGELLIPLTKSWTLENSIGIRRLSFNESSSRSINADSETFFSLKVGALKRFSKFSFGGGLYFETMPFVTSSTSSVVSIETFTILSPYLRLDYSFKESSKTDFNLGFIAKHLNALSGGSLYDFDGGHALGTYFDATRKLSNQKSLSVIPFVEYQNASTTFVDHSDLEFGVRLLYGLSF